MKVLIAIPLFLACKPVQTTSRNIDVDTLFTDKISIRAIAIGQDRLWYGADKGRYGYVDLSTGKRREASAVSDSVSGEFRSIAVGENQVFIVNAGSPAKLFAVFDDLSRKIVYSENHPDAFYDSMRFISPSHGIAVGDPIGGCFSILQTFDGGKTWYKSPCESSVENLEGEAAFAASNSNIATFAKSIWIFTGGRASRVLKSVDAGKTWSAFATPMISGKAMTGTFAGDFYDAKNGMIVGGNYEDMQNKFGNKATTRDGGKTWQRVGEGTGFGYASSVRYVPGGKAKKAVSAGPSGLFYTADAGHTWQKILSDPDLHTIIFADAKTAYAAGRGKIIRINFR